MGSLSTCYIKVDNYILLFTLFLASPMPLTSIVFCEVIGDRFQRIVDTAARYAERFFPENVPQRIIDDMKNLDAHDRMRAFMQPTFVTNLVYRSGYAQITSAEFKRIE